MKTAPAGLATWLAANNVAFRADLFTLTVQDGTVFRWTNCEASITSGGNTYLTAGASAPLVKRGPFRQSARLSIDTLDLTLIGGAFTIGGKALPLLAIQGYFRGARLQLDHLIGPDLPGALTFGPILKFFEGRVASVQPQGVSVQLQVRSELEALNQLLPKFLLQPACGYAVYDPNCGLSRAAFTLTGTVSASTLTTITTASAALTAKAAGYFADMGVLTFTSGALSGLKVAIQGWSGTVFTLALPLKTLPANGDAISAYPGCDRKRASCGPGPYTGPGTGKFANLAQWRAFPHVPSPESAA